MALKSPVPKRIKLDPSASPSPVSDADPSRRRSARDAWRRRSAGGDDAAETGLVDPMDVEEADGDEEHCVICLHDVRDRTVLPCSHDRLCFECILVWTAQSRKCPLCNAPIGPFLIHDLRSKYDYSKYYLPPLRTSPPPDVSPSGPLLRGTATSRGRGRGRAPAARWGPRGRNRSASLERQAMEDELELAVERRRWVYRHGLYAKHVASNPYTRYRPAPTPPQIAAAPDLISRATIFVRRELRVWVNLDVEFLTTFILSLMKTLDLRSESAVKLLAEFLDMDTPYYVGDPAQRGGRFVNAEHFSHELYSYLRSPFRDLATYDAAVQYDMPSNAPPAPSQPPAERRRWDLRPQAKQSSRNRRVRCLSPSPISRTPRDAYSRSPSPQDSHDDYWQYGPQSPPRPASGSRSYDDGRSSEKDNRVNKGMGREPAPSRVGAEKRHRDGDQGGQIRPSGRSRRRSSSARCSPVQSGRRRASSPSPERPLPRSHSNVPQFPRTDSLDNPRSRPESPSPSQPPICANNGGMTLGNISVSDKSGSGDGPSGNSVLYRPERDHVTSPETWGISIKGQAKQIGEPRESPGGSRESEANEHTGVPGAPKKRMWNPASLDMLHAHLGHGPPRERRARNTTSNVAATPAEREPRDALQKTGSPPPALGDQKSSTTPPPESQHELLEHDCPPVCTDSDTHRDFGDQISPSAPPLPTSQRSARAIMARTRAKLTEMRANPPVDTLAHAASEVCQAVLLPCEGAREGAGPSSQLALRARLVERLEEEKRQAGSRDGCQPTNGACLNGEPEQTTLLEDVDATGEAHRAEGKLRAQALLHVRLAAEKRRAEEGVSREAALRAALSSRRS